MNKLTLSAAMVALIAGCATTPVHSDRLDEARAEVEKVSGDPLAQQAAAKDVDQARNNLQLAETALQQRQPPQDVDHLAYLALRHAQSGEARIAEARARQEIAQAQEDRSRVQLQAREHEVQKARSAAESARNSAAAAQNEAAAAQTELAHARQELQDLQAKQTERGLVMTLGDVLFDTGQATLKPGADRALDRLSQFLKDSPGTHVIIEGHTDAVGTDDYNLALSQRRAQAVADALSARGVSTVRLETKGLGKSYPVASNDTQAGRQQNRRVEIVFSDESGRFAQTSP
ncbi:MAG TPA: OmpA family protein [Steroidobacteraceae bacterium]|nr:OmpA family protein [Steroidobacteraceae bacterium]